MTAPIAFTPDEPHVPETAFGKWFLKTNTWTVHVLDRALNDLERLIPERKASSSGGRCGLWLGAFASQA